MASFAQRVRDPMWWLVAIMGAPLFVALCLMIWALVDRSPPISYRALAAGAYDPSTRLLTLQWVVERRRYCPGELVRSLEAQIGGSIILPSVIIDPEAEPVDVRRSRVGTTYTGRANLVDIPATVGGTIKLTSRPRFWCNPLQFFAPIEVSSPPIIFTMPDPATWTGGGLSVTVGPIPE